MENRKSSKFNWDIIGHNKALQALESDIKTDNLVHAYLFAGTASIGKFTIAKRFAHILQCEKNFCGECNSCREIDKGIHSDTIEMADDGQSIKIEQIRKVLERLHMTKQSPYKIFLLQNIERMTLEASNALLKNLEDPMPRTVFLLTTSNLKEILPTIISRVRLIKFKELSDKAMMEVIQKHNPLIDAEMVNAVCALAPGKPGKALSLLEDSEMCDLYQKMHSDIETFLREPSLTDQFAYIDNIVKESKEDEQHNLINEFLHIFQLVLRKQLFADNAIIPQEKAVLLLRYIQKMQQYLKLNVNTRLLLENMMLLI
jgi:DNA polymerase III delta' subunit